MAVLNSMIPGLTGRAFDAVLGGGADRGSVLVEISVTLVLVVIGRMGFALLGRLSTEVLAKRMARGARDEFYLSLLGKSQTFHNRQRIGDLMARGANDVRQLSAMFSPGIDLMVNSLAQGAVPLVFIALLDWRLLVAPTLFAITFVLALRNFMRKLRPVSIEMRERFGVLNAGLNEVVRGVEVVKASGQERAERAGFAANADCYREAFVRQGIIQARYLPTLLLAVAMAGALLHGLALQDSGDITIGELIAYLGLMGALSFPTFVSIHSFALVQVGLISANRLLELMRSETELDHNPTGHAGPMAGTIEFDEVSFGYEGAPPILRDLTFRIEPGETVAIVGETGAGKSTITKLVNRIYDVTDGRVLVDGVDVRSWNLDSLRSQISTIEQDVVLFSRSVSENIAFSLGQRADQETIVHAARVAQADSFISRLNDGFNTVIGERGVDLSGGQRQRLAIARALITDPAILILDDSTSAIDSATEDEIQQAIRGILAERTTLLITHRLSQIRWADKVLVLQGGRMVDMGSHDELLVRCALYRRIFAHYDEVDGTPNPPAGASVVNPSEAL